VALAAPRLAGYATSVRDLERLREIYRQTPEGNGQRWLMVDIEDEDDTYRDVFRLIEIRRRSAACEK